MSETQTPSPKLTTEQRVTLLEAAHTDHHEAMGRASLAINRLESFVFSLVKILVDAEEFTLEDVARVQFMLATETDLRNFWIKDVGEEAAQAQIAAEKGALAEAAAKLAEDEESVDETIGAPTAAM